MKQHIFPVIKLTAVSLVFFCAVYPFVMWVIAKATPGHGDGEIVHLNGKVVGYTLLGQSFTKDQYFNGRPSAVNYNAAGSGASNRGPSNADYLKEVQNRIDTFLLHNPTIKKEEIPSELVTASGSGLDPDISVKAALIQVSRIAKARSIAEDKIESLIQAQKTKSLNGIEKVNVLQLNIALAEMK